MPSLRRSLVLAFLALLLLPAQAWAADVRPLYDLSRPEGAPFPNNRWTTFDFSQRTGLRVKLPKPDCAAFPTDCTDIDVINTLDGFNVQPRISIPFSGPIDPASVSSSNVFLVRLPDFKVTGINQVTWTPATNTLHVESDQQLRQHTPYVLVVTTDIRDASGARIKSAWFKNAHLLPGFAGKVLSKLAVASLFTTQSVTPLLERVRGQIKSSQPAPASFLNGSGGERTVFPRTQVTSLLFARQTTTGPPGAAAPVAGVALLQAFGTVGTLAFGAYDSPDYETAAKIIPPVGSRTGTPQRQGTNRVHFNLFLPNGTAPAGGWPVAIFGHGFGDNKNSSPFAVASTLAGAGIATVAVNVVGHGGGALGTLTVNRASGAPVTFSAGGRGIDQNGDGQIAGTEGVDAAPAPHLVSNRDGLRQTVIDLMQLVRQIEVGVDVDGDGSRDLDPQRISYFGQSFGGIYGTTLLAVEPAIRTGVPNVPGGPIIEIARLSPSFRPLVWLNLTARVPPLANLPGLFQFNENMPLRNLPPLVDTVPGAAAIQQVLERAEWVQQAANPAAYAPHLIERPLAGVPPKSIILQFARGDQTVPNPTTSAIIRAGNLTGRTTLFRNDLARAAIPALPANPHTFLTGVVGPGATIAAQAQGQIATFFASGGTVTVDPDGAGTFFETPMVGPPPEDLAFP
jgi:fermentation-respiration switch protein FrsA (DUF1100 family)